MTEINQLFTTFAGLFQAIVKSGTPTSVTDELARAAVLFGGSGVTITNVAEALLQGVAVTDLTQNVLASYLGGVNSFSNTNPPPGQVIYPKKQSNDAPYTRSETQLRSALYFPPGFSFSANSTKRPVLFVPGTGAFGGVNFISNLGKLLTTGPNAGLYDPVYLNVPGAMLDDTQVNSEYVAYAMNYVSAVTGNKGNLAVIPWSQGNPDTQWAFQYWPSTRSVASDFISISADFHGTTLAYFLDPAFPGVVPNPPSIIQQEYNSNYITTLRNGGGGSPYVPSTSIWSITDEIVQPQYNPIASASYTAGPCTNAMFTNNQIQAICPGLPAGGPYTHEGVLFNPIAYALALDALTHDGPGQVSRLDLTTICAQAVAPGLSLSDVLATEGLIPLALLNILLYPNKVINEPAVMAYAQSAPVARDCNQVSTGGSVKNGYTEDKPGQ